MKLRLWSLFVTVACLVTVAAQPVNAEESSDFTLGFATDLNSDYMWRGFNLYDGMSIQPSLDANYNLGDWGNIGANVWAHLSGEGGRSAAEKFTEVDYTAHWDIAFGDWSFSAGHIWYEYPRDSDDIDSTREIYGSIAYGGAGALSPYLEVYHDYDLYDSQYFELGASYTLEECPLLGKHTPYVAVGFSNNSEKVYEDEGVTHVAVGTSMEFTAGKFTVSPNINYNFEVDDNTENEFWVGLNLSTSLL